MVTVIVPIYNAERTLKRCVESILQQTFSDFELLLIDDGSTDKSGNICDEYAEKDSRIRVFHKKNGGVGSARNIGLDNTKGEWITFCDSDDYVEPDWLDIFMANCNKYDLVVQGFIDEGEILLQSQTSVSYSGNNRKGLSVLETNKIVGYIVKLFKTEIIQKHNIRFNENFRLREDEDFVLKYILFSRNMICVSKAGYHYSGLYWDLKYKEIDNFYTLCSMFNSIKLIYENKYNSAWDRYLFELTRLLFFSFEAQKADRKQKVKAYQKNVGKFVFKSQINFFTKLILFLLRVPFIVTLIFDYKTKLRTK